MESNQEIDNVIGGCATCQEPKEGDTAGNVEYINPASEAGQAFIDELNESFGERAATSILSEDDSNYKNPEDEVHQELVCAMEGPCELGEVPMFTDEREDYYLRKVAKEIKAKNLFTREDVNRLLYEQIEDVKKKMGAYQLLKMTGGFKSHHFSTEIAAAEECTNMELLEEGVLITSPEEVESYAEQKY